MGKEKGFVGERERDKLDQFRDGGCNFGLWLEVWSYIYVILLLRGPEWCILTRI